MSNTNIIPPPKWGEDEVTKLLNAALDNSFATFHNLPSDFEKLRLIDECYRSSIDCLVNTKNWFAALFLLKAHSAYLASCQLCISGFTAEPFACLRVVLENSLYGCYLADNLKSQETWLNRHVNEQTKKSVRNEFKISTMFEKLESLNANDAKIAKEIYERTIDFGAHPNERALSQRLQVLEGADETKFNVIYLDGYGMALKHSLHTVFQVGLCSLVIFRNVFKERFDIVGISEKINALRTLG